MLSLLKEAIDGTFHVIRRPFQQLLSIHAFVKRGGKMKHIPLCFILMSQRRKRDYRAVLRHITNLIPGHQLTEVLSDFEATLWRAVRAVFEGKVTHFGCVFHWTQAVWRKIQG